MAKKSATQATAENSLGQKRPDKDSEFKTYYLKYRDRMYWYVYRRISRCEEAQDIAADVFMKLYEHFDAVSARGEKGVQAWLYAVARNGSIDYLRKQAGRQQRSIEDDEVDSAMKVFDTFVEDIVHERDMKEVVEAMKGIDEITQEIIRLRYEEGLRFGEISSVVGKSEGACKMLLYRGIEKIRDGIAVIHQKHD